MKPKTYALIEPGGRVVRGYCYGKLTEVRYLDVVRTGKESPDREVFIQIVEQAQRLTDEDLRKCRIAYVDDKGVGAYCDWQAFLDIAPASS